MFNGEGRGGEQLEGSFVFYCWQLDLAILLGHILSGRQWDIEESLWVFKYFFLILSLIYAFPSFLDDFFRLLKCAWCP